MFLLIAATYFTQTWIHNKNNLNARNCSKNIVQSSGFQTVQRRKIKYWYSTRCIQQYILICIQYTALSIFMGGGITFIYFLLYWRCVNYIKVWEPLVQRIILQHFTATTKIRPVKYHVWCTHPVVFALQQVKSASSLDSGQKPYRMTAYETFE